MLVAGLLGVLTSLTLTAIYFLFEQLVGLPFVPFDVFDEIGRILPGGVITVFIQTMVTVIRGLNLGPTASVAKLIEQALAVVMMVIVGGIFGAVLAWGVRQHRWHGPRAGQVGGFILFILAAAAEFAYGLQANPVVALLWMVVTLVAWGHLLGGWVGSSLQVRRAPAMETEGGITRRVFLTRAAGSVALALAAVGLGNLVQQARLPTGAGEPLSTVAGATPPPVPTPAIPGRTVQPVPGTRPEVTPNSKFYRIDIDLVPPSIQESSWTLEVAGLFDKPRTLTLSDLRVYPAVTEPRTLSCISNPVGGDLIGNTYWTGLRIPALMKDLGIRPEAKALRIDAADGFFEFVTMADLADPRTLLVYGMDGDTLPAGHGFPLRILIPNRYGMKQPKWITKFTAVDRAGLGYWVERGWSQQARPRIVSVIDTIDTAQRQNGRIPIGGIAWAGGRGVSKVEVQVDNGPWEQATLITPPLGPLTWVDWRYDWPAVSGNHTFTVRAADGNGVLQTSAVNPPEPDGATGYYSVSQTI